MTLENSSGRGVTSSYGIRTTTPVDKSKVYRNTLKESPLDLNTVGNSLTSLVKRHWDKLPGYIMIGDSTLAQGNRFFQATSITSYGRTATLTFNNHGLAPGSKFIIRYANESEYNGYFTVTNRVSNNVIEYQLESNPTVSTATGSILLYSQDVTFETNWPTISDALAQQKGLYLGNYALGGSRTSDLSYQLDTALDPNKNLWGRDVDFVFISSGINDVINSVSYEEIISNLESAIERIIAANAVPIVSTMFPLGSAHANWSIAVVTLSRKVNTWIKENVPLLGGVVIDSNSLCIDLDSQYGDWITNYSVDHIHPQKMATFQVAKEIKRVLWDNITTTDDRELVSIAINPTLSGTGGTESGTGASGDTADNFSITCSGGGSQLGVGSKGLSLTGVGESQRLAVTGASSTDVIEFKGENVATSLSPGDKVVFRLRSRSDSAPTLTGLRHSYLQATAVISGSTITLYSATMFYNNLATQNLGEAWDLLLETPPITIPEGLTSLLPSYHIRFNSSGGPINFDLSEYEAYKIIG